MNDSAMKQRLLEKDVITAVRNAMNTFSYTFLNYSNAKEVFSLAADRYVAIQTAEANELILAKEAAKKNPESGVLQEYFRKRLDTHIGIFSDGLAPIIINNRWGFIDENGRVVVELKYFEVEPFSEGLARVVTSEMGLKCGFVDKTGEEVVELKYDYAESFAEGLSVVGLNKQYGFIDKTGRVVIELKYDDAKSFNNCLAKVKWQGKWLFIDKKGQPQDNPE
jgi:hypothetical protein